MPTFAADSWAPTDHPPARGPRSTHLSQRELSETIKVFRPAANRARVEEKGAYPSLTTGVQTLHGPDVGLISPVLGERVRSARKPEVVTAAAGKPGVVKVKPDVREGLCGCGSCRHTRCPAVC